MGSGANCLFEQLLKGRHQRVHFGELPMGLNYVRNALLSSVALATFSTSVWSQDQQAQVGGVEEIVVTARQRIESLQEIPLAIAAFSSEDIQKAGFKISAT
jgi:outer membrane receptor protein involved in Fe transport